MKKHVLLRYLRSFCNFTLRIIHIFYQKAIKKPLFRIFIVIYDIDILK